MESKIKVKESCRKFFTFEHSLSAQKEKTPRF